ncbi:MAG: hypothetical protein IJ167_00265, partial [Lachnospiraceae bacterium]|nr:hypothetical protein [Lachnospiraceae bacterium]
SERDYARRDELLNELRDKELDNLRTSNGPVLATGMAEYDINDKRKVSEIFDKADVRMYANKQELKAMYE